MAAREWEHTSRLKESLERAREGCMSVPDFTGDVKRATRLVVRASTHAAGVTASEP